MSAATSAVLARLSGLAGAERYVDDAAELAGYEIDGLRPAAAVRPNSADEAAEMVRFACAEKLALVACGGRSKLSIGMPPSRYVIALDISRLNQVISYDPDDLTLSVQAGMRLEDLQRVLAGHRQFLPFAPPFHDRTTLGGLLATNSSGALRQFYGTARDFLLGMEFISGEGVRIKSGGRVVKSVAGYDIHKLHLGALGTLGVITSANFKTFPLPPVKATFLAVFPGLPQALEMRRAIAQSPLGPHKLEILSPEAPRGTGELTPLGPWSLLAEAGGNDRVVERHARDLKRMADQAHAASFTRLPEDEAGRMWTRLRELPAKSRETSPAATIVKISALPALFGALVESIHEITARHALPSFTLLRAAGVIYLALLAQAKDEAVIRALAQACAELLALADKAGGAMIEWCPVELKHKVNVWGAPRGDLPIMQRLKKEFDPQNILSPGRYLGGI